MELTIVPCHILPNDLFARRQCLIFKVWNLGKAVLHFQVGICLSVWAIFVVIIIISGLILSFKRINKVKDQCVMDNLRNCALRYSWNCPQASPVHSGWALEKLWPCKGADSYLCCVLDKSLLNLCRQCEWLTWFDGLCHLQLCVQQRWLAEHPYQVRCPWWICSLC